MWLQLLHDDAILSSEDIEQCAWKRYGGLKHFLPVLMTIFVIGTPFGIFSLPV